MIYSLVLILGKGETDCLLELCLCLDNTSPVKHICQQLSCYKIALPRGPVYGKYISVYLFITPFKHYLKNYNIIYNLSFLFLFLIKPLNILSRAYHNNKSIMFSYTFGLLITWT